MTFDINTKVLTVTDGESLKAAALAAAEVIRHGGLAVFPTETVYGLGADGTNGEAAKKIYAAKGRPSDNPLIIHIENPEDAEPYAVTSPLYYAIARAFMPGPITVIMPRKDTIPTSTTGGLDTVAVRCPSHPVAREIIKAAGVPIAAPSANLSGKPSPTSARHCIDDLSGRVDIIIDGGECDIGLESTIVKIDTDSDGEEYLTLLRPGAVTRDALLCICPKVDVARAVSEQLGRDEKPLSPGMKYRHYAPTAPLVLLDGDADDVLEFLKKRQSECRCAILCYDEETDYLENTRLLPVGKSTDMKAQAHLLFSNLRLADKTDAEIIYAHLPPSDGLGLALYNRMIRAAAHTVLRIE